MVLADKDLITAYWEKEKTACAGQLALLRKKPGRKALHELRVGIKKLRATLSLYAQLSGNAPSDEPLQETEKLFKILGRQRDLEIGLALLAKAGKPGKTKYPELKKHFKQLLLTAKIWSRRAIRNYRGKNMKPDPLPADSGLFTRDHPDLVSDIRACVAERAAAVRHLLKDPHKTRQNLKEIFYWISLLPGDDTEITYDIKNLKKILDDLGEWQDYEMMLEKIRHFRKDNLPKPFEESGHLKDLEKNIKQENEKRRKSATRRTRQWIKKIVPDHGSSP